MTTAKLALTIENIKPLYYPILTVWGAIASDIIESNDMMGETLTDEMVIESCIDADHLTMYTNDKADGNAAQALVRQLIKDNGYDEVLTFLAKQWKFA